MSDKLTLGSLFDGSGGFPLAGTMCGIQPRWAAEVEPYPIAVTKSRFPNMKHLGDITKVNGAEIEPVDIITFGSPCQDLSVAGKRAGLKHEANGDDETTRSGLFMEAVRIVKEMREETNGLYPTFVVWENVHGAFSSNNGEDFRIVLEEIIKIVEPTATMPQVPKGGWAYADSYVGDGWSLAYRVFDAQYWGVPQRRRRIYLVADFRGERAREILFEREGLRGYFETGRTPWQTTTADAQGSVVADDREGEGFDGYNGDLTGDVSATLGVNCGISTGRNGVVEAIPYTLKIRSGCAVDANGKAAGKGALIQTDLAGTISTSQDQYLFQPIAFDAYNQALTGEVSKPLTASATDSDHTPIVAYSFDPLSSNSMKSSNPHSGCREVEVARTLDTTDPNPSKNQGGIAVVETIALEGNGQRPSHRGDGYAVTDKSYTLNTAEVHGVVYAVDQGGGKSSANVSEDTAPTLCTTHGGEPAVAYGLDRASFNQGKNAKFDFSVLEEQQPTLTAKGPGACSYGVDCRNATEYEEVQGTLQAKANGGFSYNCNQVVRQKYIVRRLTPTECARLQGFPDWWSYVEAVDTFSQKDYQFWLGVRKTHDAINGRQPKDYNVKQMLSWYNKLWTDSSEYKMWGNGIALPCALYVMQGIAEAAK